MPSVVYTGSLPGTTVNFFPESQSLANWSSLKVTLTEGSAPNTGRWTGTADVGTYAVFEGSSTPANFSESIGTFVVDNVSVGSGPYTATITVLLDGDPVEGASVSISKAGETHAGITDVDGVVTLNVEAGTWTVAITAPGNTFSGASLVVDGDEDVEYTMTSSGAVTPSAVGFTTGYWTVYTQAGVVAADVDVVLQLLYLASSSTGIAGEDAERTVTSDEDGIVSVPNMFPGATYQVRIASGTRTSLVKVPADAGATVALKSVVG